jgi:hypothetical protein
VRLSLQSMQPGQDHGLARSSSAAIVWSWASILSAAVHRAATNLAPACVEKAQYWSWRPTVIGSVLCQTFIAKLTTGRFGVLHLNINGWPIRAIPAPVPSVISLSSAISHDRSPHYHAVVSYYKSATFAINKIILGSNFFCTLLAAGIRAREKSRGNGKYEVSHFPRDH